jgi:GNAT superfamily N-acetyltransferase
MDTATAWSLFIAGFTGTAYARRVARRFRAGPLDAVRFAGDEDNPREPFDEYFVARCAPEVALAAVAAAAPLAEHYLTVLEDRPGLELAYARGGYRLSHSETLMACELAAAQVVASDPAVLHVQSADEAAALNAADPQGISWIVPDNLADPRMAHYAILRDGQPVARGRSFRLDAAHSYISRVYTAETHRGQGLARALMARIRADDIARGARWSVLTASGMGERLYLSLGYRPLGTIHIFEPSEDDRVHPVGAEA